MALDSFQDLDMRTETKEELVTWQDKFEISFTTEYSGNCGTGEARRLERIHPIQGGILSRRSFADPRNFGTDPTVVVNNKTKGVTIFVQGQEFCIRSRYVLEGEAI